MPLALSRVFQPSSTSGTDTFTLDSPPLTDYRSLVYAAQHLTHFIAGPWTIYYLAHGYDVNGKAWEIGTGTLTDLKPYAQLTRTTVHSSSNAGSKVAFLENTVILSSTLPATDRGQLGIGYVYELRFLTSSASGVSAYPASWGNAPTVSEGTPCNNAISPNYREIGNYLFMQAAFQYDTSINGHMVMGLHISTDGGSTWSDAVRCTSEFHVAGSMGQLYLAHIYQVGANTGLQFQYRTGLATASCTVYRRYPPTWTAAQATHGMWWQEYESTLV